MPVPDSEATLAVCADRLYAAVESALDGWVLRSIARHADVDSTVTDAVVAQARADVLPRLAQLLGQDIDDQRTTPLSVLRDAARFPTAVLAAAGVPAVARDRDAAARFPDDVYDLVPATFADIGPDVADAGLRWGAAKAFEHKRRHRD